MESQPANRHPFEAAYRGVASIALGAVSFIFLSLVLWLGSSQNLSSARYYRLSQAEEIGLNSVTLSLIAVVIVFPIWGVALGIQSWILARRLGEPQALSHVGLTFCALALIGWAKVAHIWLRELNQ